MSSSLERGRDFLKSITHRQKKEVADGNDSDEYEFVADNDTDSIQSLLDSDHPHVDEMAMSTISRNRFTKTIPNFNAPREPMCPKADTKEGTTSKIKNVFKGIHMPPPPEVFGARKRSPIRRVAGADPLRAKALEASSVDTHSSTSTHNSNDEDDLSSAGEMIQANAKKVTVEDVEKRITERVKKEVEERVMKEVGERVAKEVESRVIKEMERKMARRIELLQERIRSQQQDINRKNEVIALKEDIIARLLHERR